MISYEARLPHMRIFLPHMMLFLPSYEACPPHMNSYDLIWSHMILGGFWTPACTFFQWAMCSATRYIFLKDPFCRNQIWQIQFRSPFAGPVLLWALGALLQDPSLGALLQGPFFQQLRLTYSCPSSSPSFSSSGLCATQCHLCCCWPPAMLWAVAVALPLPSGSCRPLWACLLAGQGNAMCTQQVEPSKKITIPGFVLGFAAQKTMWRYPTKPCTLFPF